MQKIDYFPDRLIKDRITLLGVLRGRKWGLWGELGHWPMSLRTLSCSDPVLCSLSPWLMSLERQTALFGPILLLPRSPAMDFEKTMKAMSQNTSSFVIVMTEVLRQKVWTVPYWWSTKASRYCWCMLKLEYHWHTEVLGLRKGRFQS